MNDPSQGMQCSGIRRSFGGGEGFRAHIQAAGRPTLATFRSWPTVSISRSPTERQQSLLKGRSPKLGEKPL